MRWHTLPGRNWNASLPSCTRGRTGGRRPKLTKEQHEQIARLIKNGHDRKQLAIIYGIGTSTIYRYHPVGDIQTEETTGQTQENENR
ncbi:Hin recombinase [Escherichia coli]